MDNLCHSLVGAALAECGLRRRTRYATFALVIGANLPDADVLALFGGDGLGFRRGITHGIPALILWPFVLTGLIVAWSRLMSRYPRAAIPSPLQTRPAELLKISALAILTHPTLDWMNVYGMRWLMPFDGTWVSADALFIVDPWLYLLLGAAWIVGRTNRHEVSKSERFARGMVAMAVVYVVAMMSVSAYARGIATRQLGLENPTRRDLMIAPVFLDSWRRRVTAKVDGVYRYGSVGLRSREVWLDDGVVVPSLQLLEGQPRSRQLESLLDWARFPFARQVDGVIWVDDARYAGRAGRSFAGVQVGPPTPGS